MKLEDKVTKKKNYPPVIRVRRQREWVKENKIIE